MTSERVWSVDELAEHFGLSAELVESFIVRGELEYETLDGTTIVTAAALRVFIDERRILR